MTKEDYQITVAKPFLPPIDEYVKLVEQIWNSGQLTNQGPLHNLLENELSLLLGAEHVSLFCNGTIALIAALQQYGFDDGEVITTPFSFAATAHAIKWAGLRPVFVDIERDSLNLDPTLVEAAINKNTKAILPVHVFGNACAVDELEQISAKFGLKLIFDAAHAFGANCHCGDLMKKGDCSVLSFHSTKVFHTIEGGLVVSSSAGAKKQIDLLRNFGIVDERTIIGTGLNGKMNEFEAAMGLAQLPYLREQISHRELVDREYRIGLKDVIGIEIPSFINSAKRNFAYFPILLNEFSNVGRDELHDRLSYQNIKTRPYFYPLLSNLPAYTECSGANKGNLPVANQVANEVLCLPISATLAIEDVRQICREVATILT